MRLRWTCCAALHAIGMLWTGAAAVAQDYPSKPVRLVTSDVGGAGDFVSRNLAPGLAAALGQQIVIENRPAYAAELVARAAPDGYTVLLYGPTVWITPLVRKSGWDPLKDFSPIGLTVRAPNLLVVTPSLPVRSVKDLVALARARPGEINFASSETGSSTHLAAEMFKWVADVLVQEAGITPLLHRLCVAPLLENGNLVGVITDFKMVNPHSFVYLDVTGADGKVEHWNCEMSSVAILQRNGVTKQACAPA